MTGVLIRKGERNLDKKTEYTQKEESHMKTEAETGVLLPPAKDCLGTSSWRRPGSLLPQHLQRERDPDNTFISGIWSPELGDNKFVFL